MTVRERLPDAAAVLARAARIEARDGAPPLSDQALTRLTSTAVRHFVADGGGYAQLAGDSLEVLAEDTDLDALLTAVEGASGERFLVWTHGTRSPLEPVLDARGYERARILHRLLLPSLGELPGDPPLADGVTVRAFEAGRDEDAWLALNAAAFAHHPEQGSWQRADLEARIAEAWFDPAGFLLAERGGRLLGYHWTKIHPDGRGEVYVLGVDPAAQGLGLGAALLVRGLRHLRERGCPAVLLYVDDDNGGAVRLYERFGFVRDEMDVQWRRPASGG